MVILPLHQNRLHRLEISTQALSKNHANLPYIKSLRHYPYEENYREVENICCQWCSRKTESDYFCETFFRLSIVLIVSLSDFMTV